MLLQRPRWALFLQESDLAGFPSLCAAIITCLTRSSISLEPACWLKQTILLRPPYASLARSLPLLWSIRRGIRLIHQDWPACTGSLSCLMGILTVLVPAGPRQ